MNRFQRSWQLFKSSLTVMGRDKRLLLFPILTTGFTIALVLLFAMPVAFQRTGFGYGTSQHWEAVSHSFYAVDNAELNHSGFDAAAVSHSFYAVDNAGGLNDVALPYVSSSRNVLRGVRPLAVGYFAVMYFATMFCATFFNVAFYQQILEALAGQPVSILAGLRFAVSKWKSILLWTFFAGVVGYIIKTLEQRFGLIGQIFMKLVGAAWSIACVFVIPVIITETETSNPLVMLKKSAKTLTQTWGESLIGYVGLSFGSSIMMLFSLVWLAGGIAISMALHLYWMIAVVALAWLALVILWSYVLNVASQIFRCALFLYASQGAMPQPYTVEMAEGAWKRKG